MDYQGNSNKGKAEKEQPEDKHIEKVVSGEIIQKKPPFVKRFKTMVFGGDFSAVARYVASDVLLPAVRNLIFDASTAAIQRSIYGDSSKRRGSTSQMNSRIQYNNPFSPQMDPRMRSTVMLPDQPPHPFNQPRREANEIIIPSKQEAEAVMERMYDILDKYGIVSLSDLYELLGLPTAYTDNKWGWTGLPNTQLRQVRNGWVLDLPSMEPL